MKALLVHPEFPTTFWGFQHSLPLVQKRASLPPLGLITMAAHLPREIELRLVDMNAEELTAQDLSWADVVLVGGMRIQAPSMHDVLAQAQSMGKRTVVGGPAATTSPQEFTDADVVFQGEVEGREDELACAVQDLPRVSRMMPRRKGDLPSLSTTVVPRFDLLNLRHYVSMSIQYSRGCPFQCEFCDVIELFGRVPRVKSAGQVLRELTALHDLGYRGSVFFVDDNFVGNMREVRKFLPLLKDWQEKRGFPLEFYTEASVNLARDLDLAKNMVDAGFSAVFLGIETPSASALEEVGKRQNLRVDLEEAVLSLTRVGLEVMGGFVVGFDSDGPQAFDAQRNFLVNSPIPLAMIGILTALPGTALWRRLEREGRLRATSSGDQFDRPNFEPKMDEEALLRGYAGLLASLYSPDAYYRRCEAFLRHAPVPAKRQVRPGGLAIAWRTAITLGIRGSRRRRFWSFLARALRASPGHFAWAIVHAIQGEHLIRYTWEDVLPRIEKAVAGLRNERELGASATTCFAHVLAGASTVPT
ncbi:MAG: B12-binding domain-containing radical SAM protein [Deltaproteobacteria bacterium]|nr:B12-binding domain-containing radical SAM protein [Deltaproteobacteria bacterium]